MVEIKVLSDFEYSLDGISPTKFKKGTQREIPRKIAKILVEKQDETGNKQIEIIPDNLNVVDKKSIDHIVVLKKELVDAKAEIVILNKTIKDHEKTIKQLTKKISK